MFGVSPAYFFSLYSTDFTVEDYKRGLDRLSREGFGGYQLEIFHRDRIGEWLGGAADLATAAKSLGMAATQFVAHFLLFSTRDEANVLSDSGLDEMKRVADIVGAFEECKVITLPVSPFFAEGERAMDSAAWQRLWNGFSAKLLSMARIVESAGLKLALEIVPGSLLGGTEGLLRLSKETGNATIGYNFDTGHAWSCKECIQAIPARLAGRIYGTHLKDNFGTENLALPPGEGNIPWNAVMEGLLRNGYSGSFDLEIACAKPEDVEAAYSKGLATIRGAELRAKGFR